MFSISLIVLICFFCFLFMYKSHWKKQGLRIKGIRQLVNANNFSGSFNHSTKNITGIHLVKVTCVVDHSNHHDQNSI